VPANLLPDRMEASTSKFDIPPIRPYNSFMKPSCKMHGQWAGGQKSCPHCSRARRIAKKNAKGLCAEPRCAGKLMPGKVRCEPCHSRRFAVDRDKAILSLGGHFCSHCGREDRLRIVKFAGSRLTDTQRGLVKAVRQDGSKRDRDPRSWAKVLCVQCARNFHGG